MPITPTPMTTLCGITAVSPLLCYFYYDAPAIYVNPQQFIIGTDHFRKLSQELRFASPADKPFRVIGGAFYQRQTNLIHQDYQIDDLAPDLSVNGFPGHSG